MTTPSAVRWLAGAVLLAAAVPALAADETREFATSIDGKPAGGYQMTIATKEDGTVTVTAAADVTVKVLIRTYRYTLRATEVRKDGLLVSYESTCNDDGKQYAVSAAPEKDGLHVKVNGREHLSRADAWLTTFWQLPDARTRGQVIPLLDADTGKDMNGTLQLVGTVRMAVGGEAQNCGHYRLSGGPTTYDLWYDAQDRLIRQEWTEDGHKAVLDLARIRR
jgi:hypothetical protein